MAKKPPRLGLAIPVLYHFASGLVSNFSRLRHYATRLAAFPRCRVAFPILRTAKASACPAKDFFMAAEAISRDYRRNPTATRLNSRQHGNHVLTSELPLPRGGRCRDPG